MPDLFENPMGLMGFELVEFASPQPNTLEPLFQKRMDGFSVLFHQYSVTTVGTSSLQSRATGGLIGTTFVFVLPGSRGACRDAWEGILRAQLDNRHKPCNFVELMPRLAER